MTKTLEEILQTYFGCSVPFRKDGELTTTGEKAMRKLEGLLADLEGIGVIPSACDAVRRLDEIMSVEKPDNRTDLDKGIDYVREQMDKSRLIITRERVTQNLKEGYHVWAGLACTELNIRDWLEEYGSDNDLPKRWWEEYGDIDDILLRL